MSYIIMLLCVRQFWQISNWRGQIFSSIGAPFRLVPAMKRLNLNPRTVQWFYEINQMGYWTYMMYWRHVLVSWLKLQEDEPGQLAKNEGLDNSGHTGSSHPPMVYVERDNWQTWGERHQTNANSIIQTCHIKMRHTIICKNNLFLFFLFIYFFFCGAATQSGSWPPHSWGFLDHTQRRTTVGRSPLDEWSARRRDLYLITQHSHQTNIHNPGGIRTHNLSRRADRAATGTGIFNITVLYYLPKV